MNIKELNNKINSLNNSKFKIFQSNINNCLLIISDLFNKQKGGINNNFIEQVLKKHNINTNKNNINLIKKEMLKLNNNIKGGMKTALNIGKSLALSEVGEEEGLSFTDIYDIIVTYKGLILQFVEYRWKWTQWLFMGINIILYVIGAFSPLVLAIGVNLIRLLMNGLRNDKVSMILDAITIFIPISNSMFVLPFSIVRFIKQSIKKIKDEDINLADAGLLKPLYNKADENAFRLFKKENPGDFDEQKEKWNKLSEFEQEKYDLKTKKKHKIIKKTNTNSKKIKKGGNLNNDYFIHYLKYKIKYLNKKKYN